MKLENSFEIDAPPAAAWDFLMDVPRVVPCMPGAELVETVDDNTWKAKMKTKLGPIGLVFDSTVRREDADEAGRRVRLNAQARDQRGRGQAQASIESALTAVDGGTRIDITTDVVLSGAIAQYGRGILEEVSSQLVASFAECLRAQLASAAAIPGAPAQSTPPVPARAKPVSGLSLLAKALFRAMARWMRRLVRRGQ